ncbi:MAG: HD domain-containing protein [Treponema sp.]|nr:HD domain-containing protein [Treponema sp.]
MHIENDISIFDFVCTISEAVDLVSPLLNNHHKSVAYISCNIALKMDLSNDEIQDIVLASMLHDIGSFSTEERIRTLMPDHCDISMNQHAILGYMLLKEFEPLSKAALLIKHHHRCFDETRDDIPIGSYIISLADRISILFDEKREILTQVKEVYNKISLHKSKFHPDVFAAFERLVNLEYVWVDTFSKSFDTIMLRKVRFSKEILDLEMFKSFAKVIAQIIDFKSRFTATHSSGVAAVARELCVISGFSERECRLMEIAGLLHDLGKLSVSNGILEKNGRLTEEEFNVIRKHTYYTYAILSRVTGMEHIAEWAAYHHERQDGNGYPFHVKGEDFSKLARIMAVADVITALTEDRPYRPGMNLKNAAETLVAMSENGGIDRNIVDMAINNFSCINDVRLKSQQEALKEYNNFHDSMHVIFRDIEAKTASPISA